MPCQHFYGVQYGALACGALASDGPRGLTLTLTRTRRQYSEYFPITNGECLIVCADGEHDRICVVGVTSY